MKSASCVSQPERVQSPHSWLALGFLALVALAIGSIFRYPLVTDDPFITYRYAQNLVDGQGLVYNPGEHVLSTTAPLYSFVLAALGSVFGDIPFLGFWMSVLGLAVCAWSVFLLAGYTQMRLAGGLAALLTLLSSGLVLTFGLETCFYLALALGAAYLYLSGRSTPAFALLALLTLTRNDGVLLAAILGLDLLWGKLGLGPRDLVERFKALPAFIRRGRGKYGDPPGARSRRTLAASLRLLFWPFSVYLLILTPWLAFAWWWFSSPFPFTLTAKIAQAQSGLWDPFAVGFLKWLRDWLVSMWVVALFALIGLVWAVRSRSRLLLLALWAVAHLIAYSILGVAFYAWYVAPFLPVAALFAGVGAEQIAQALASRFPSRATFPAFVSMAGLAMLTLEVRADLSAGMQQPSPKVQAYHEAALWIAQNTTLSATVDALEVGVIGYYDKRRTYDFVGLVDPTRIPYLRSLELSDGVRHVAADYVIMIPPDVWLPQDPWFKATYQPVEEIRAPGFYSGRPLIIYRRADIGVAVLDTVAVNLSFDKRVDLIGVDLFTKSVSRGGTLPIVLHLRADQPLGKNNKFTLQLVGTENRVVAQSDTYYPARNPEDGKPFLDHQGLPVARDAPPGVYELILAMYNAQSGERATLFDASGGDAGDLVPLGKIEVH